MSGEAASSRLIAGSASVRSTAWGFGLSCVEPHAGRGRRLQRDVAAWRRRAATSATPRLSASARARMSSAVRSRSVPACRGAEAVVDQERDRASAPLVVATGGFHRGPAAARMTSVASSEPQQRQPPRRARRRVFLRLDVEQQPRRRKFDAPRPRRNEPQQPPQDRQAEQAQQNERLREAERQAHHAGLPSCMPRGRRLLIAASLPSPMRAVQRQQELVGRAVGAVDGEAPAEPPGLGASSVAVPLQPRLVVGAPVLGAAGGDHLAGLRARRIRCGRNRGRSPPPGRRSGQGGPASRWRKAGSGSRGFPRSGSTGRTARRSPKAKPARSLPAGSARSRGSWMMASAMRSITARLPVGRVRPGRPTRSPASTSTSASAKAIDQRAVELAFARELATRTPSTANGRARSRWCARPPIPARGHRDGRRGRSGASRCGGPPRRTR